MYLFGDTKIFMREEAVTALEKKRSEIVNLSYIKFKFKMFKKEMAALKFQKAWFRYKKMKLFRRMRRGIISVQRMFRTLKERRRFKSIQKASRKIQRWWKNILKQRRLAKMKKASVKIQGWWKMRYQKKRYQKILHSTVQIQKLMRGGLVRRRIIRLRHVQDIIEHILEKGAHILMYRTRMTAATEIQRWVRGHLCRCKYYDKVLKIRKFRREFIYTKSAIIIQRNVKGFIVRSTLKRLNRAAFYIQGFIKMKWLSSLFSDLRVVAIKIQRAVRCWLVKKRAVEERMQSFITLEESLLESLKTAEQVTFFGSSQVKTSRKPLRSIVNRNTVDTGMKYENYIDFVRTKRSFRSKARSQLLVFKLF